ncbi:hypothetical protein JTB14_021518 [Gonioctena quinquepunctata]|nr:hypothetical protein JTB14_021518 [Gonioctena quinquepunctata]
MRIKQLESNISKLNAENIEIDGRNTELKEELHRAITQISKLQADSTEYEIIKNNMLTTIKTLPKENECYFGEIKKLKNKNFELKAELEESRKVKDLQIINTCNSPQLTKKTAVRMKQQRIKEEY